MNDLLQQGWFALEMAWYRVRDEIGGHISLTVMLVVILLLIWHFLSPEVKKKGS